MKKSDNKPIVLSGRGFVSKLLAIELPSKGLPRELQHGDVKLLAIPKGHGYAGFVRAYVYDTADKRWRNLALRGGAAVEAIYKGPVERVARARACIEHIRTLKGSTAAWGDSTYKVAAPQPQDDSTSTRTTTGAGADSRPPVAAVPATPATTRGATTAPGSDVRGKSAVEPVGKPGEQLRLF